MKAERGLSETITRKCSNVKIGECLCGRAALSGEIEFSSCLDNRHSITYDGIAPHGHYCVPVKLGGEILGIINVYLKDGHNFNQTEVDFLSAIAKTLAGVIKRDRIEQEKSKLEAQLYHSQKIRAVGQLIGGIAHDFNNIITAIIGYGNLLKIKEDDSLKHTVEQILASAEKAATLTQGLLAFSRKQIINPRQVNPNNIIKRIEGLILRLVGENYGYGQRYG